jgi:hypothetical protein
VFFIDASLVHCFLGLALCVDLVANLLLPEPESGRTASRLVRAPCTGHFEVASACGACDVTVGVDGMPEVRRRHQCSRQKQI